MDRRCLYSSMKRMTASLPSLCGMFVYKDVTSTVTKNALVGMNGSHSRRLIKCFVSLLFNEILLAKNQMK